MSTATHGEGDTAQTIRRILFVLLVLGIVGLSAELVLLEHTESVWQWIPFVVLAVGLAAFAALAAKPARATVLSFRAAMALFVIAGVAGLVLHFRGNLQFELENDPSARGLDLVWRTLRGATPTLAPAALAQLGLMGIAATFRHPALRPHTGAAPASGARTQLQERP
jgi:hypothetical protein